MTTPTTLDQFTHEPEESRTKLDRLRDRPDKFVRPVSFIRHGESYPDPPDEALRIRDNELQVLQDLGINMPHNEFVEMAPGQPPKAIEAPDRVFGDNLMMSLIRRDPGITGEALSKHYTGLLDYLKLVHDRGGYYMSDVTRTNDGQYMYGHTAKDLDPKIYLVDLEPILAMYHLEEPDHPDNKYFYHSLNLLEGTIKQAEMFGQNLEEVHDALRQFREEIHAPNHGEIQW